MSSEDSDYYRRRAAAELEMADAATDANAAAIHQQLALEYAALVADPGLRPTLRVA